MACPPTSKDAKTVERDYRACIMCRAARLGGALMIDTERRLRVNTDEVAGEVVESEAILINFGTGRYYTMDKVGVTVWQLIEGCHNIREIASILSDRYVAEADDVLRDLENLVHVLIEERLVVFDEQVTFPTPVKLLVADDGQTYSAPSLHPHTDMAEILALDPPLPVLKDPWHEPSC